ncbi:MAG: hypothetical protein AAB546_03240 [Patescibacteria group bacterium]
MSDLTKIKIWKILSAANHFWVVTLVLYFQFRGLTLVQALQVISIYSILVVVLEYPTGVIGDYFSHRTSVLLGNIVVIVAFALLSFPGSFAYYVFLFFLFALGMALVSGSDTALLHSLSKDFKKDLAQTTPYALILSVITISIGSLAAAYDMRYPIYLSFLFSLLALPLVIFLKDYQYQREEGNIFSTAFRGIKDITSNSRLKNLIIVSSVFGAFFLSIKWFYNPLFEKINIPVTFWGLITSGAFLLIAVGVQLYRKKDSFGLAATSLLTLAAIFLIGVTSYWLVPLFGIWLMHILRGYQDTLLGVEMNEAITTNRRASILSFDSLLTRLGSAIYIAGAGLLLPKTSFLVLMLITILFVGSLISIPLIKLNKK